jgi:hypothetical protein
MITSMTNCFEAPLNRIKRGDPSILGRIRDHRSIVSFRNILAHGCDSIDDRIVWGIIEEHLDDLLQDVEALLGAEKRTDEGD